MNRMAIGMFLLNFIIVICFLVALVFGVVFVFGEIKECGIDQLEHTITHCPNCVHEEE